MIIQDRQDFSALARFMAEHKTAEGRMSVAQNLARCIDDECQHHKEEARYRTCANEYAVLAGRVERVCEVGAGDGVMNYRFGFGKDKEFWGVDIEEGELERMAKFCPHAFPLLAFGEDLPFDDNYLDLLLCTETLEHFPNPAAGLREFFRVVRPDGHIILTIPNATYLRNLNPFHMLVECSLGQVFNSLPQRVFVHENMWHNGVTHHHDFTIKDLKAALKGLPILIERSYTCNFPFLYLGPTRKPMIFDCIEDTLRRIPVVKYWGRNLVVVLKVLAA